MINKFKSLSNSKISRVIVALIAIPFVFWVWVMFLQEEIQTMLLKSIIQFQ